MVEKSLDEYLLCTLREGGANWEMLVDLRECGAENRNGIKDGKCHPLKMGLNIGLCF